MAWDDRLRTAYYLSPSGKRFEFTYGDVSKQVEKKTSLFIFPGKDGAYVQDLGRAGRRYPLRVIFWGPDYDLEANDFEVALEEKGPGVLSHPSYGLIDVVPFGTFSRSDALVSNGNQAVITVTFFETFTDIFFPASETNTKQDIKNDIADFKITVSDDFDETLDIESVGESINVQNTFTDNKNFVDTLLEGFTKTGEKLNTLYKTISSAIVDTIENIATEAKEGASQLISLYQTTTKAYESGKETYNSFKEKYEAYKELITHYTLKIEIPGIGTVNVNKFLTDYLFASGAVAAAAESAIETDFESKPQALETVETLLEINETLKIWLDDSIESLGIIDTGGTYDALQNIVSKTAAYLVQISFTLKQERVIILDRARSIVELTAELYGDLTKLDFLISSNALTGDEILELPEGKKVLYYK